MNTIQAIGKEMKWNENNNNKTRIKSHKAKEFYLVKNTQHVQWAILPVVCKVLKSTYFITGGSNTQNRPGDVPFTALP